jgi:hypothetical protein
MRLPTYLEVKSNEAVARRQLRDDVTIILHLKKGLEFVKTHGNYSMRVNPKLRCTCLELGGARMRSPVFTTGSLVLTRLKINKDLDSNSDEYISSIDGCKSHHSGQCKN